MTVTESAGAFKPHPVPKLATFQRRPKETQTLCVRVFWEGCLPFLIPCTDLPVRSPECRVSLVVQWLGIRLPMQGTRVRALVREDPTCQRATKPVRRNY